VANARVSAIGNVEFVAPAFNAFLRFSASFNDSFGKRDCLRL
jgi:hypothetical protein